MANDYFTPSSLTANTKARSTEVNTNLTALEAGFDKLPSPTAVKNRITDYVAATAASANTYTATLAPVPSAYVTGMKIRFTVDSTNTGAATLNLNSLGAKQLVLADGTALSASYLSTTVAREFVYDGTKFVAPAEEVVSVIGAGSVTTGSFASSVYASQVEAEAGTENTKIMTPLRVAQAIAGNVQFSDADFRIQDNGDATKQIAFQASGITTGTTRTVTFQDADGTVAFLSDITNLVDSAPGALDTLNELAAALGDDANFATTVTNALALKANSGDLATVATSGSYSDLADKPTSLGWTQLATSATTSGTQIDFTGISQDYTKLLVLLLGVSHDDGSNQILSMYTSGDSLSSTVQHSFNASVSAGTAVYSGVIIDGYTKDIHSISSASGAGLSNNAAGTALSTRFSRTDGGVDSLRFQWAAGDFDAGTITIFGA